MTENLSITFVKSLYQNEKITPRELIENIIEKAALTKGMNMWIVPPTMERMNGYLEKLGEMDFEKKPLWGIPFAIKDNIDLENVPTTAACSAYEYIPEKNASVVERLVEAGAIPLGKTNLDQFATGLVGTRSPYGEVHNSLREELISGGSSSGSAVAVAKGLACFALGTDTAGSGRVPAALNRLVGFKPTCGAWSLKGVVPACASLDCVTVFAQTTQDVMLVDSVVRGLDDSDCWSKEWLRKENELPKYIYVPEKEPEFYGPFAGGYQKAWEATLCQLEKIGSKVEKKDLGFYQEAALLLYGGPCVAERWADLGEFVSGHREEIFPVTRTILETGNREDYTAGYLYQTMHQLMEYKRRSNNLLKDAVMVLPTCAGTYFREEVRNNPIDTNSNMGKYTNHCNLLDMSAVAVPGVDVASNLPFGITIFGRNDAEHKVMATAEALEQVIKK